MVLDPKTLATLTRRVYPEAYVRCTRLAHRANPLGMGFGDTRFASPANRFKLLYIAEDLATSIAETVIRDRFEGTATREITRSDLGVWGACEVDATRPLRLLDLRKDGCFRLGLSTEIVGAKAHTEARAFSQQLYDGTDLDGIIYASRLLRRNCIAVYDRSVPSSLISGTVADLSALADLVPALSDLGVTLLS